MEIAWLLIHFLTCPQLQNDFRRVFLLFASRLKAEIKCLKINALKIKHTQCMMWACTVHYLVALFQSYFHVHFHQTTTSQISCNKDVYRKFCDYFSTYKIVFSFAEIFNYIDLEKKANDRQIKFYKWTGIHIWIKWKD